MKNLIILIIISLLFIAACQQPESRKVTRTVKKPAVEKPVIRDTAKDTTSKDTITQNQDSTITIAAVGDIMLGTAYPDNKKLPPDSAKGSFRNVLADLKHNDIVFGNLEGTLLDTGNPVAFKKKLAAAYLFRMPASYGKVLKDAGFNLLSVANNHITDFGDIGCTSTTKTLDTLGIHYAGLDAQQFTTFTLNGVRYGFCAFAPNAHTTPMLNLKNAARIIQNLKQQSDIVIVSFHGGGEGTFFEHVSCTMERYMGEKRGDVHAFAHNAIDAGADIVLGSGPHVSRAMELYNGRLIAYSLGNFCTYKSVSVAGVCGLAPLLKARLNKKGEFMDGQIIAYRQTHEGGVIRDSTNAAARRIKLLTELDFEGSGLRIGDDGKISPLTP